MSTDRIQLPMISVALLNKDSQIPTQQEMQDVADALTQQACEEFAAEFGISARVRVIASEADRQPGEWLMILLRALPVANALGYHTTTSDGKPIMYVSPELDQSDGVPWSTTASHELLETLGDRSCMDLRPSNDGNFDFFELCDAVEADSYEKTAASGARVLVSNWVTDAWFTPPADLTGVKYDHMGLCTSDHEIRQGGYMPKMRPDGTTFQARHATVPPRAGRLAENSVGRRAKIQTATKKAFGKEASS
jgi:hypothetical protein